MDPRTRDSSDDELMVELKQAVAGERPAPDHVLEAAKAAFDWRRLDEQLELLTLSYDSSLADVAGVRGPARAAPRMLVFDGEHVTVELELGPDVLMGQVVPAEPHRIVLESADGQVDETDTDDAGVFLLRRPAKGPVRLRCQQHDVAVVTEWTPI